MARKRPICDSIKLMTLLISLVNRDICLSIIESIIALQCLLVDYGETLVRTDVMRWFDEHNEEFKKKGSNYQKMAVYRRWFEFMIETLNKYGLLFDTMPRGFSNVEMKSVS